MVFESERSDVLRIYDLLTALLTMPYDTTRLVGSLQKSQQQQNTNSLDS